MPLAMGSAGAAAWKRLHCALLPPNFLGWSQLDLYLAAIKVAARQNPIALLQKLAAARFEYCKNEQAALAASAAERALKQCCSNCSCSIDAKASCSFEMLPCPAEHHALRVAVNPSGACRARQGGCMLLLLEA